MERAHVIKIDCTQNKYVEDLIAAIHNGDFAYYLVQKPNIDTKPT